MIKKYESMKTIFMLPVPMPIEKYNVIIFRAHILITKHILAIIEPAMATIRHPNLFTNQPDIGPLINLLLYFQENKIIINYKFT